MTSATAASTFSVALALSILIFPAGSVRTSLRRRATPSGAPLAVEKKPIENFFSAEEYHQKYLDKNPAGYCHIPTHYFSIAKSKKE